MILPITAQTDETINKLRKPILAAFPSLSVSVPRKGRQKRSENRPQPFRVQKLTTQTKGSLIKGKLIRMLGMIEETKFK
jgi:hypothetical protein